MIQARPQKRCVGWLVDRREQVADGPRLGGLEESVLLVEGEREPHFPQRGADPLGVGIGCRQDVDVVWL